MLLAASLIYSLVALVSALETLIKNGLSDKAAEQLIRPFHLKKVDMKSDVGFYQFAFGNTATLAFASFHYYSDNYTSIQVLDGYCPGDVFGVYDNGIHYLIAKDCGINPLPPPGECPSICTDPEQCMTLGQNCGGIAYLPPGQHNITILTLNSPFTGGSGFIRLQTMCFLGGNFSPCCSFTNSCNNGLYETV